MTSEEYTSKEHAEFDGYEIPPYDPTIPPKERKRLRNEAKKKVLKTINQILASKS